MGGDSLQPFLDDATRGSFILCKTSNPGSNDLQILPVAGAATVFEEVAKLAQDRWNSNGNVGLVVGATDTVEGKHRRPRNQLGTIPRRYPTRRLGAWIVFRHRRNLERRDKPSVLFGE